MPSASSFLDKSTDLRLADPDSQLEDRIEQSRMRPRQITETPGLWSTVRDLATRDGDLQDPPGMTSSRDYPCRK